MRVVIIVKGYWGWEPRGDDVPTEQQIAKVEAKPSADGKWLWRVHQDADTHVMLGITEVQIDTMVEGWEARGEPRTRNQVIADLISGNVAPHHSHPDNWLEINVHDEPELQKWLAAYFNIAEHVAPESTPVPETSE